MKLIAQLRKDWRLLQETLPKENSKIECFIEEESAERLISFLIVAEDHRYKYHIGFDIIAIIRACFKLLINGKKEGASIYAGSIFPHPAAAGQGSNGKAAQFPCKPNFS